MRILSPLIAIFLSCAVASSVAARQISPTAQQSTSSDKHSKKDKDKKDKKDKGEKKDDSTASKSDKSGKSDKSEKSEKSGKAEKAEIKVNAKAPDVHAIAQAALEGINAERKAKGLAPLVTSPELSRLAEAYSRDMVERRYFSHVNPEGKDPQARVDALSLKGWINSVGENVGQQPGGNDVSVRMVHDWMGSARHRDNILDRGYTETGIGVWVDSRGMVYFTQVFLNREKDAQ